MNEQRLRLALASVRGALLAAILVVVFLSLGGEIKAGYREGGILLRTLPLIMVPVAGALGGAFYFLLEGWRHHSPQHKTLANAASAIVYCLLLGIAFILGLDTPP